MPHFPAHGWTQINTEVKSPKQPTPMYNLYKMLKSLFFFNWPKSCPICPRSSGRSPAAQCSSLASQRCRHFSWISQTDRMRSLVCPPSRHCYICAQYFSSCLGLTLISPCGLCSFERVQRNRCSFVMVQSDPHFPSRLAFGMVTSLLYGQISWGAWGILGRAPNHSVSLPWATRARISLCKVPIVAYHETNPPLHQQFPTYHQKSYQHQ